MNEGEQVNSDQGLVTEVKNCARCGKDHKNLVFLSFTRPCGDYTHWALCPESGEPILLRVTQEIEADHGER